MEPVKNAGSDYRWRATVARGDWDAARAALAAEIDYPSFKNAVAERQGPGATTLYAKVWSVLFALQRGHDAYEIT